ncbi:hypothetical protein TSH100_24125 [Azospirillum sp. TSH100]|nr:hypothetical protein TSH100_24125 [Azospirillum sp. TSH100]
MLVSLRLWILKGMASALAQLASIVAAPSVCVMFRPPPGVNGFMKKFLGTLSPLYEIIVPC